MKNVLNQASGENWTIYHADSVDALAGLPANSVHLSVFSPPFSGLYIYSDSIADMGNCANDDEFIEHYKFLAAELHRVTKPGRISAVHCKDLVYYANAHGTAGLRDFPGMLIRAHQEAGWDYHSRITIWKDPVIEMQRTKAHGLLYKQLRTDSTFSRQGLADYVLLFRKWAADGDDVEPVTQTREEFPLDQWQQWASPVWMDIRQTNVLNVQQARDSQDEKHICPLQLDVIERIVKMYSNRGDVVLSPFAGIGSEGYVAVKNGRRFVGFELKDSYFAQAQRYLDEAERSAAIPDLFQFAAGQ